MPGRGICDSSLVFRLFFVEYFVENEEVTWPNPPSSTSCSCSVSVHERQTPPLPPAPSQIDRASLLRVILVIQLIIS